MSDRDLRQLVGGCLFLGVPAVEPDDELRRFLDDLQPGGVILFARNLREPDQVVRLNARLRGHGPRPRLLGVDQEGGRVERLRGILGPLPPAAEVARGGPPAARELGRLLGRALAALGFNLNFAPVLDLSLPGAPNGIGDRSFGDEAGSVTRLGRAYLEGLAEAGLLGVLKHFPGLGPTHADSHDVLPRASKDAAAFQREDLRPFRELAPLAPAIMVGHAHYPFLEPRAIPASCSERIVGGLLREELGYDGVVITDDLEMGAVDQAAGWTFAGAAALAAGCDMLMVCHSGERMRALRDHLVAEARAGRLPDARLRQAADRVGLLRERIGPAAAGGLEEPRASLRERFGRTSRPGLPPPRSDP